MISAGWRSAVQSVQLEGDELVVAAIVDPRLDIVRPRQVHQPGARVVQNEESRAVAEAEARHGRRDAEGPVTARAVAGEEYLRARGNSAAARSMPAVAFRTPRWWRTPPGKCCETPGVGR
jgi:hypothetical protein